MEISAVVMAAGKSKRMKSRHSKVVFQVSGKAIIQWVADALFDAGCRDQVYIVGEAQAEIRSILGENVAYVLRKSSAEQAMPSCRRHLSLRKRRPYDRSSGRLSDGFRRDHYKGSERV